MTNIKPLMWDAHACLPLRFNQDMSVLERHRASGVCYVSVNVGQDFNPLSQVIRIIAGFRAWLANHEQSFVIASTVEDIHRAHLEGKLAVAFDLEGSMMLQDDLAMIALFRDLGVRQIHLAYNRDNSIGGGCHGANVGLTAFGRQVVAEINRAGLIMDCSHSGYRTSMEVMEISSRPVVFSHSNIRALQDHPRNIRDEQIDACARTNGVIGLTGMSRFIGQDHSTTESFIRHIDYVAQRVGPRHVGIGLDFVFDPGADDQPGGFRPADWWPAEHYNPMHNCTMIPPERFSEIGDALLARGYAENEVLGILGRNFLRVAETTWRP